MHCKSLENGIKYPMYTVMKALKEGRSMSRAAIAWIFKDMHISTHHGYILACV